MSTSEPIIETNNASREFDGTLALQDLTLRVPRGSIYGFLGRNGAGKTTAIKMLAGLIKPTSGTVRVLGRDPFTFTPEDRRRVTYLSEKQILPANLSIRAIIKFTSSLYPAWDHALTDRLLKRFRLDGKKKISALSQGAQRQVAFILALAPHPDLMILDEPASTLDVVARREFLDEVLEQVIDGGPTIFLSSHILSDIERVADHIGILVDGVLKVSEPLDDLKESVQQVRFHSASYDLKSLSLPGTLNIKHSRNESRVTLRHADEALIVRTATQYGAQYEMLPLNLEDIFVAISQHTDL